MADYIVEQSFDCPSCGHQNGIAETTISAENAADARNAALNKARCTECGLSLPADHLFRTTVKY
jgi:transcription elongation factor Elf1